jgi:hypothetical protein
MIVRVWHAFAPAANSARYGAYLKQRLLPTYLAMTGNRGVLLCGRTQMGFAEFLVVSMWESVASLEALVGEPESEQPIAEMEAHPDLLNPVPLVKHYEVMMSASAAVFPGR